MNILKLYLRGVMCLLLVSFIFTLSIMVGIEVTGLIAKYLNIHFMAAVGGIVVGLMVGLNLISLFKPLFAKFLHDL